MNYHLERPNISTDEMFENYNLTNLPYPINPNDVHLYEDQHRLTINVFSFYDDEGKVLDPLENSQKNQNLTANLLYWNENDAPITDINRLLHEITKHKKRQHI